MKKYIFIFLTLAACNAFAQDAKPKSIIGDSLFKNLHATQFIMDGGYITGEVKGKQMQGFTTSYGVAFNNFWNLGLSFDFMNSRSIQIYSPVPVVNPRYNYSCFMINNEFLVGSKSIVTAAFPLRFGVAYSNYFDKYSDNNQHKTIADDVFFVAEVGADVYFNFFKAVSLGGGIKYRWATDVQSIGTNADYNNYAVEAKLRFRFFDMGNKSKPGAVTPGM